MYMLMCKVLCALSTLKRKESSHHFLSMEYAFPFPFFWEYNVVLVGTAVLCYMTCLCISFCHVL